MENYPKYDTKYIKDNKPVPLKLYFNNTKLIWTMIAIGLWGVFWICMIVIKS